MRGGWYPVGRVALSDPSLSPGSVYTPREAYFDLCDRANASGGSCETSVRTLALAWGWSRSTTHRFLLAREENGQVQLEAERTGLRITIAPPWDNNGTRNGTQDGTADGTRKPHESTDPHQSVGQQMGQEVGQELGRNRDTGGSSPSLHSPPPTEGEKNTGEGARAREELPQSTTKYVCERHDLQRLTKLLDERLLFGVGLDGALWDEQAVVMKGLVEQYGPERVQQAIEGAAKRNAWPFDKGEAVFAPDLRRHFSKALAAFKANGNGASKPAEGVYTPPETPTEKRRKQERAEAEWLERVKARLSAEPTSTKRRLVQAVRLKWDLHPESMDDKDEKQRIRRAIEQMVYQEYGREIGDPSPVAR